VIKYDYSDGIEPPPRGSTEPHDKALGTAQPAGRTESTEPSQLRRIDASNEFFNLSYYDPPKGLERHILALFDTVYPGEVWEDRHPAVMGQMMITTKGEGIAQFDGYQDKVVPGPYLMNAFDVATPFRCTGPWRCLGVSFSPFGWAALMQQSVMEHKNRFLPARELLGPDIDSFTDDLIDRCNSGKVSSEQACREVAEWVRPRLRPIPDAHEDVIYRVLAWLGSSLNPAIDDLFENQGYSRRQLERIVQRYFGFAPRGLARKFRAIRAANLLAQPTLTDEGEAELAEAFVDQPHMIREIRRFCGYTPTRLGGSEDPMFIRLSHIQNLDRFKPYRAVGTGKKPDGPPLG
jgi:AraC-like DNA-binding protein